MKRTVLFGIACVTSLLLASCASHNTSYIKAQVRNDLVQENWIHHATIVPNNWTQHADKWFYTDEPRNFNDFDSNAPVNKAITAMMVRVPDFTNITVDGPYRVQIYGSQLHNTVYVLGPNESARHTAIDINGSTLYIHPAKECAKSCANLNDVIIRVGIHDLNTLKINGSGMIEGKLISSSGLNIKAAGTSEILLTGQMTLRHILQAGLGTITVIGAYSPEVDVKIIGNGNVNLSGRIGIRHIMKQGSGNLNIMGVDTDGLDIRSAGSGVITLNGYANLRKIEAINASRVYIYWVNSNGIYIHVRDNARIGLAGNARNIDVEVAGTARFEGKYLRSDNIYVRTIGASHANVTPNKKLFANALDNSTIYFFGSPDVVSRYTSGNGIVLPIFNDACPIPIAAKPLYKDEQSFQSHSYKDEGSFGPPIKDKGQRTYRSTDASSYQRQIDKGMRS